MKRTSATTVRSCMLAVLLVAGWIALTGRVSQGQSQGAPPAPDNTQTNQNDQQGSKPTADQQKENPSDRGITEQIRQSIVKDKSLSIDAHNVKIISQNGEVTLKGPVKSDEEKQAIESKATAVAGVNKVINELEVKPNQ